MERKLLDYLEIRNWENIIKEMASRPKGSASVPPLILPGHSSPNTPFPYPTTAPFLVSTNIYFISLTFSLGPDEAATVWWL